ncbi:hypothetical protein BKE30_14430 [Alkanindiges hydrocarboniclasticus]|uniref:Uncharacterized protein n=1 Tax=Alkanindiges hydrocarboniclasticus TaxID=1907941 RepID=A0A1S8CSW5_9GAMM|nr:hypothetical protein BKE30_14430 [Alkanindiges hydrocarboniclasticus]
MKKIFFLKKDGKKFSCFDFAAGTLPTCNNRTIEAFTPSITIMLYFVFRPIKSVSIPITCLTYSMIDCYTVA